MRLKTSINQEINKPKIKKIKQVAKKQDQLRSKFLPENSESDFLIFFIF